MSIPGLGGGSSLQGPPEFAFAIDLLKNCVKIVKKSSLSDAYLFLDDVPTKLYQVLTDREFSRDIDSKSDDYIHCEQCGVFKKPWCLQHPLFWCPDRDPKERETTDGRATYTAPPFLKIRNSTIPKAGMGVLTNSEIPVGMVFGPYQGMLLEDKEQANKYGYAWEIRDRGRSVYIDGSNARCANWMRFINSSRHEEEQNLLAFQYNGSVYYRVIKPILPETELLVWYGTDFGKTLGVLRTESHASKKARTSGAKQFVWS